MVTLIRILIAVYYLSINLYSFMLVYSQKKQTVESGESRIKDAKLFFTGVMGGALGQFIASLVLAYRRESLLLIVVMPLLTAITVYFITLAIMSDFAFFNY